MSDDEKTKDPIQELSIADLREIQMYKDYLRMVSVEDIAAKYELTPDAVYKISQKNEWKKRRRAAKEVAYKNLDKNYKSQIVDLIQFLQQDYMLLMKKCLKEKREMTKEERSYILSLLETATKENRLYEGKPTEITNTDHVIRHEVILPPGVKRFGIIPPAANVTLVEAVEVKASPEHSEPIDDET